MNILVINSGSSSIKYQYFDMRDESVIFSGSLERIGETTSRLAHQHHSREHHEPPVVRQQRIAGHREAFALILEVIQQAGDPAQVDSIDVIGHRVVHGGEAFRRPSRIDAGVVAAIRDVSPLAPLHNPANLTGIEICLQLFPRVPQVAVFDTAFHQTMPATAYRYALPDAWYRDHGVRRYGFHGTSHSFVAQRAAEHLGQPLQDLNIITLHLGNGASAAAIRNGICVDTSMGLTPLEGLVMGTRSGDIDPAILFHMHKQAGLEFADLETTLNRDSGLKGISGVNDMREARQRAADGDAGAALAIDMYCYRIRKYIGAYCAVLGRVDAIVFTAGVGENSAPIRAQSLAGLDALGIVVDPALNAGRPGAGREIQSANSRVKVLVIRTDEELSIARQARECVGAAAADR